MSSSNDPNAGNSESSLRTNTATVGAHVAMETFATADSRIESWRKSAAAPSDTLVDRRSPLQLENEFVQKTKDQIRLLVGKIASSAQSPIDPIDFVSDTLPQIIAAMAASGALLWNWHEKVGWTLVGGTNIPPELLLNPANESMGDESDIDQGSMSLFERLDFLDKRIAQTNDDDDARYDRASAEKLVRPSARHRTLLDAVKKEGQPILIPPGSVELQRDRPTNPTDQLLVCAPLPLPPDMGVYWLQVIQPPSGGPTSQRGYLRFVAQMADLMSEFYKSHRLRTLERDRDCLSIAESTMSQLSIQSHHRQGAARLMNVLREHAAAEHVFLLRRESYLKRWRVVAAAGIVDIDKRATGIAKIVRTAPVLDNLLPMGGSLRPDKLAGSTDDRDPDLARWLETFAVTEARWIKLVESPQVNASNANDNDSPHASSIDELSSMRGDDKMRKPKRARSDVALLVTWSGLDRPPVRIDQQLALIGRLGLGALQITWWKNAVADRNRRQPLLQTIVNPLFWPSMVKTIAIVAILCGILAVPVPFNLHATAILMPSVQQHVYAPMDSIVEEIMIEHGQSVVAGQPIMQLRSLSLESEYEQALAQQLKNAQRRTDIENKLLRASDLSASQRDELEGERDTLAATAQLEQEQLQVLRNQIDSLRIKAEMDGVIATWNVHSNLRDRPLRVGQWLLSLHQPKSTWTFEASMPERDAEAFRNAMARQQDARPTATLTSMPHLQLPIEFIPQSAPRIELRDPTARDPTTQGVLCVRFAVEASQLPASGAIAGATSRISIPMGRASLVWVLGRDFALTLWAKAKMWV
jgi:hypothetical protein